MDEWRKRLDEEEATEALENEEEASGEGDYEDDQSTGGLETSDKELDKEGESEGVRKEEESAEGLEESSKGIDESTNGPRLEESTKALDKEEPMDEWRKRLYE
ncbi:hypothetical protein K438DRAFT_1783323 [Mycena galopus ATCC 62051]|nr:hypothetical protein K438DRAFT_1783323 [Mycena galopus ATCC 62051]